MSNSLPRVGDKYSDGQNEVTVIDVVSFKAEDPGAAFIYYEGGCVSGQSRSDEFLSRFKHVPEIAAIEPITKALLDHLRLLHGGLHAVSDATGIGLGRLQQLMKSLQDVEGVMDHRPEPAPDRSQSIQDLINMLEVHHPGLETSWNWEQLKKAIGQPAASDEIQALAQMADAALNQSPGDMHNIMGDIAERLTALVSRHGAQSGWDLADKVRTDLDRQSCPDAYMRVAVDSIVKHYEQLGRSVEPTWAMIRDHLGADMADKLCVTSWKDGIDIQEPLTGLKKLIAACAPVAAQVAAEPAQNEREAFEKWARQPQPEGRYDLSVTRSGVYVDPETRCCYRGWVGRAALTAASRGRA